MHLALSVKSMFSPVSPSSFSRFWSLSIENTWSSNWTRTHTLQKCKLLDYTHVIAQCFSNRLRCIQSFCRYWISMRFRFSCYYTCIMVEIFNVFCFLLLFESCFFIFQNGGIKHPKIWRINYGDSNKFQHPLHILSFEFVFQY